MSHIPFQIFPMSKTSTQAQRNTPVLGIGQSSEWYTFAFRSADWTNSSHKPYHEAMICDRWPCWRNSKRMTATLASKECRSCPLWMAPAKNLSENWKEKIWILKIQWKLKRMKSKLSVFFTFSMVYSEVPMNTTLMGKSENMMPLWMSATILKTLSHNIFNKRKFFPIINRLNQYWRFKWHSHRKNSL